MTLTLYGSTKTRGMRPVWLLEELGLDYRHVPSQPRSAEISALTPLGKVPILEVDGVAITDSTAILTFLADREERFTAPAGTARRGRQDALTFQILDEFDALLWTAARHKFILPEERRVPAIKESLAWEFARNVDRLTPRFEGDFLTGDTPTVPDFILAHCGLWARLAGFSVENETFAAHLARMTSREAFGRAKARD